MLNAQDRRNESGSSVNFARATAMFLVLVVTGYAVSTQVESAVDASRRDVQITAQGPQQGATPTTYFPAQYVNQARDVEDHIQAF